MPPWATVLVLVVVFVASGWQGLQRGAAGSGGAAPPTLSTPLLSARRLPAAVGDLVASERLAAQLAAVLPAATGGLQACIEVAAGASPVFAENAALALLPASNIKLLAAYAALTRLGRDAHLTTSVVADGKPSGGVIDGSLYLVGGGDPLLATAALRKSQTDWTESSEPVTSLEALADRIKAAGITEVRGGVVGDDSRYDAVRTVPTWKPSYVSGGQVGPVGALEVNSGFRVVGGRRTPETDPATAGAAALTDALTGRGVKVGGVARAGRAPASAAPVAAIDSLPMVDVVGVMLRESDNLAAEMLTKELGVRFGGAGSWPAGLRVIHDTLTAAGLPLDGLVQVDGSGLDRTDRVSCRTLAAVLSSPSSGDVAAALPTAGDCGTLVKRFRGTAAAGRIRAKTGSLAGVAALSGYVVPTAADPPPPCPPGGGRPDPAVTFALLVNGVASTTAATAIEDQVAITLASFPQVPVLGPLGPQP